MSLFSEIFRLKLFLDVFMNNTLDSYPIFQKSLVLTDHCPLANKINMNIKRSVKFPIILPKI